MKKKVDIADTYNARGNVIGIVEDAASPATPPATTTASPKVRKSTVDRALALGGATTRIKTGIATLDEAGRGGLPIGKLIVFGGAPGSGKTTLDNQIAWTAGKAGVHVTVLAADEDADGLLIRIGQAEGLDREELEAGDPEARQALADVLKNYPNFVLIDADEDGATVEEASEELKNRRGGGPSLLMVDSIQTARVVGIEAADVPRARIDMVMTALKRAAKRDNHLVLAPCELARGAYRSQNAADRIDDLAAFKESGGIEYGASMALVLRTVPEQDGVVDVSMPKNRLGRKLPFRLSLNHETATFREVDRPAPEDDIAWPSKMQAVKDAVLKCVSKTIQPINSGSEIQRRIHKGKSLTLKAIRELVEEGQIATDSKGNFLLGSNGSGTGSETAQRVNGSTVPAPIGEPGTGTASWNRSEAADE